MKDLDTILDKYKYSSRDDLKQAIIEWAVGKVEACNTETEAWVTSNFSEETYKPINYYIKKSEAISKFKER